MRGGKYNEVFDSFPYPFSYRARTSIGEMLSEFLLISFYQLYLAPFRVNILPQDIFPIIPSKCSCQLEAVIFNSFFILAANFINISSSQTMYARHINRE